MFGENNVSSSLASKAVNMSEHFPRTGKAISTKADETDIFSTSLFLYFYGALWALTQISFKDMGLSSISSVFPEVH